MSQVVEVRCPYCGAVVATAEEAADLKGPLACHHCHRVVPAEIAVAVPRSGKLDYFSETPAEGSEGKAFRNRHALVAAQVVLAAVALGLGAGLSEPGPTLRKLAACLVFLGGLVGMQLGLIALKKKPLGHVDKSLAVTAMALGGLCLIAGVKIFTRG